MRVGVVRSGGMCAFVLSFGTSLFAEKASLAAAGVSRPFDFFVHVLLQPLSSEK